MAVCQPDTSACTSPLGALSESAMRIALFCLSLLTGACRGDPEALAAASRAQLPADDGFATRLCHATLDQTRLQVDMRRKLAAYPKQWGLKQPDTNIDHRRVPNLETFFRRRSAALPVSARPARYQPGDLMTCTVAGRLPHIAIVVPAPDGGPVPWIVHNIGQGPKLENRLFEFPLTGHYRWRGE